LSGSFCLFTPLLGFKVCPRLSIINIPYFGRLLTSSIQKLLALRMPSGKCFFRRFSLCLTSSPQFAMRSFSLVPSLSNMLIFSSPPRGIINSPSICHLETISRTPSPRPPNRFPDIFGNTRVRIFPDVLGCWVMKVTPFSFLRLSPSDRFLPCSPMKQAARISLAVSPFS